MPDNSDSENDDKSIVEKQQQSIMELQEALLVAKTTILELQNHIKILNKSISSHGILSAASVSAKVAKLSKVGQKAKESGEKSARVSALKESGKVPVKIQLKVKPAVKDSDQSPVKASVQHHDSMLSTSSPAKSPKNSANPKEVDHLGSEEPASKGIFSYVSDFFNPKAAESDAKPVDSPIADESSDDDNEGDDLNDYLGHNHSKPKSRPDAPQPINRGLSLTEPTKVVVPHSIKKEVPKAKRQRKLSDSSKQQIEELFFKLPTNRNRDSLGSTTGRASLGDRKPPAKRAPSVAPPVLEDRYVKPADFDNPSGGSNLVSWLEVVQRNWQATKHMKQAED